MKKFAEARGGEKEHDKKAAAQTPVKMEEERSGQSEFSREARYSLTRP